MLWPDQEAAHTCWLAAQVGSSYQRCEGCPEDVCQTAAQLPEPGVEFMAAGLLLSPLLWLR